jgi:hypothetical protein
MLKRHRYEPSGHIPPFTWSAYGRGERRARWKKRGGEYALRAHTDAFSALLLVSWLVMCLQGISPLYMAHLWKGWAQRAGKGGGGCLKDSYRCLQGITPPPFMARLWQGVRAARWEKRGDALRTHTDACRAYTPFTWRAYGRGERSALGKGRYALRVHTDAFSALLLVDWLVMVLERGERSIPIGKW